MVYNQDALLAQIFAAQRAMAMGQIGFNDQSTRFGANSKSLESSPLSAPMEKLNADTVLQQVRQQVKVVLNFSCYNQYCHTTPCV